jgi:hypothetical protein
MKLRLVPNGKRLVFPDGHVEEGFNVEFDDDGQGEEGEEEMRLSPLIAGHDENGEKEASP